MVKSHYDPIQDIDTLDQLDAIYIESRYPNEMGLLPHGKPSLQQAQQFYNFAKQIYEAIKTKIEAAD